MNYQSYRLWRKLEAYGDLNDTLFGQNVYVDSLESSYIKFIGIFKELQKLIGARISPQKKYSILEGTALEEYIIYIEEKRATIPPEKYKYSECHIEGNRIY